MAHESGKPSSTVSTLCYKSAKINLVLVLITLMCEACLCTDQATDIENPSEPALTTALENQDVGGVSDDDLTAYKRHLGSIAALSGSKPLFSSFGGKSFIPPSKKHLGSIAAAQSSGRFGSSLGRKLGMEMYKRHLGALRAQTGSKAKPLTRSLKDSPTYHMEGTTGAELDASSVAPYTDYYRDRMMGLALSSKYNQNGGSQEIWISPEEYFAINGDEAAHTNEFSPMNIKSLPQMDPLPSIDEKFTESLENNGDDNDVLAVKSKRFLGSLARGGWFPRQFRGIVSENGFGKRHIGSLARLGWMPQSHLKGSSRLGMVMDEARGEYGIKRNELSPRRRILYHFAAPSLWTSPRGK